MGSVPVIIKGFSKCNYLKQDSTRTWLNKLTKGGELHSIEVAFLPLSRVPGSILCVPENLFRCCCYLSMALVSGTGK